MFTENNWKDYRLIDASSGERLEKWGEYTLIRPDPQIIWNTPKNNLWKKADGIYQRSKSGGGSWIKKNFPAEWTVKYRDLTFSVSPMNFKHTGIFPEQATNWDWITETIKNAVQPVKMLNLFAYTGAASVAAAKAGAFVCHVDASKGIIAKAKKNAALSEIPENKIRYIADDCIKFIEREIRRGNKYDAIVMDPPSYGRGSSGEVWQMSEMADSLISLSEKLLSDSPLFFLLNSYTTGLSSATCEYLVKLRICEKHEAEVKSEELGIKVENSGLYLPCGSSVRVLFKNK